MKNATLYTIMILKMFKRDVFVVEIDNVVFFIF